MYKKSNKLIPAVLIILVVLTLLTSSLFMSANVGSVYFGDEIEKNITVIPDAEKIMIYYWNRNLYVPLIAAYTIESFN